MKILQGYKQSEFGIIPEDWVEAKWGECLATFSSGATPYRGVPAYYKGNVKWISSGELNYNVILDTIEHISEQAVKDTNLKVHQPGTMLIAITGLEAEGTRGRCALVGTPATTNQSCLAINGTDKVCIEYLFEFYKMFGCALAFKYCQGTKQQSFTAEIVKKLPIIYPRTIDEQKAIAKRLSEIDELIAGLGSQIEKRCKIKEGAMQQLLTGKKRIPGFCEKWTKQKIGDICRCERGTMLTSEQYKIGNIPVIAGGKSPAGFHNEANRRGVSITVSCSGASAGYVSKYEMPIFATDCFTIGESEKYNVNFIYYILQLNQQQIYMLQTGGAQPHVHPKDLQPFEILYTSDISEQNAIAQILGDMDNEIVQLEAERDKYTLIKQGMMQELLTGKTRLV